jgi:hypothetical protein
MTRQIFLVHKQRGQHMCSPVFGTRKRSNLLNSFIQCLKIKNLQSFHSYIFLGDIQSDQKENKSEQALQIIGHVVAEFYVNKRNNNNNDVKNIFPTKRQSARYTWKHSVLFILH